MTGPATATVVADLRAEGESLDALVAGLPPTRWADPTPAAGWTIAHQIGHLAWTDEAALAAVAGESEWRARLAEIGVHGLAAVDLGAAHWATLEPSVLLDRWRAGRAAIAAALLAVPPDRKLPWYGPPMSPVSMATARLMETWAHGEDVAATLGVIREPSARLRHVVHLGWRTRGFSYAVRGLPVPDTTVRLEVMGPDGEVWRFGPDAAAESVTGPAVDFARLVTQRIHRDDTALRATGPAAEEWLRIAQAFAGPPGAGRPREAGAAS